MEKETIEGINSLIKGRLLLIRELTLENGVVIPDFTPRGLRVVYDILLGNIIIDEPEKTMPTEDLFPRWIEKTFIYNLKKDFDLFMNESQKEKLLSVIKKKIEDNKKSEKARTTMRDDIFNVMGVGEREKQEFVNFMEKLIIMTQST